MKPHDTRAAAGLTLVEILVASALGMIITALTWSAFMQAKGATMRGGARVGLHLNAAYLHDQLKRDFTNLAPALAMFVSSTPTTAGTTRSERIEIVFMRSTAPLDKQVTRGDLDRYLADHHWVRWLFTRTLSQVKGGWKVDSAVLKRSSSTPTRTFYTTAALPAAPAITDPATGTTYSNYNSFRWLNLPRPLRDASGGVASLNNNRFGVPAAATVADTVAGDIGDLTDLTNNEQIVSTQVQDLLFGWEDAAGNAVSVDGQTAMTGNLNGLYLDVVGPDNGRYLDRRQDPRAAPGAALNGAAPQYDYRPDLARRPRIIRVALRFADTAAQVKQTFSWSFVVPGTAPALATPAP